MGGPPVGPASASVASAKHGSASVASAKHGSASVASAKHGSAGIESDEPGNETLQEILSKLEKEVKNAKQKLKT